jgi:hypothetical protein
VSLSQFNNLKVSEKELRNLSLAREGLPISTACIESLKDEIAAWL